MAILKKMLDRCQCDVSYGRGFGYYSQLLRQ